MLTSDDGNLPGCKMGAKKKNKKIREPFQDAPNPANRFYRKKKTEKIERKKL